MAQGVSRTIAAGARHAVEGFVPHLDEACIGSISEVFDAEEPFTPRGCIAQAWSVAEVLRVWVKLAQQQAVRAQPRLRKQVSPPGFGFSLALAEHRAPA